MSAFRDAIKDIAAVAGVVGEARRVTGFISDQIASKKDLKKEIDVLKDELRREQKRRQDLEIAIRKHKKEMEESNHPRRFECDNTLWALALDTFAPDGKLSDHPIKGRK